MGHDEHHKRAHGTVACAVITVSDTRTEETDASGRLMRALLEAAGHRVVSYRIVPDEPEAVAAALYSAPPDAQAVLFNGGTGISRRDRTFEAVAGRFDKTLPGFGELFRWLSYQEIGTAAVLSRAAAGVASGRVVLLLPGSENAVRLGMEKLVLPELAHMVWEAGR